MRLLKKSNSYIKVSNVPPPPKRKINWGKYVYFSILGLILFFAAFYLGRRYFYIEGIGQVIFNKLYIQHTRDIRVLDLYVKEGSTVKKGDRLFSYVEDRGNYGEGGFALTESVPNEADREIARVQQNIAIKGLERKGYEDARALLAAEYANLEKQVLLEAYLPDRLNALSREMENKKMLIRKSEDEIAVLNGYLERLKAMKRSSARAWAASGVKDFYSKVDGVVTRIYPNEYEVVLKGDTVMDIYKPEEITIKAFFDQEYIDYLKNGLPVKIKFPDGSASMGVVSRYYFATVPLPPEFQKRFEPVKRMIAVDIAPYSPQDALLWKSFYKMSVDLYISRMQVSDDKR